MHKLDLGLYSHPKEFWGNGVRTHVNCKGKIPSTGNILLRLLVSIPQSCSGFKSANQKRGYWFPKVWRSLVSKVFKCETFDASPRSSASPP